MSDEPQNGPGAELKAAREGMDVSTREVADALNLPVNVIESLETDDFERLPPTVFTRGYLRSYARLLELSPDSLLARYPEVTEEVDAIIDEMPTVEPTGLPPTRTLGIAGAVGLVLIGLLVWLLGGGESDETVQPAVEQIVESSPEASSREPDAQAAEPTLTQPVQADTETQRADIDPVEPVVSTEVAPDPVTVQPLSATTVAAEPEESARREPTVEPSESSQTLDVPDQSASAQQADTPGPGPAPTRRTVAGTPGTATPGPSYRERRITEFGDDEITLVFSEDCWVEVKSASGENLYSDLNRTGRTLVLTGRAPFRVLLGYAPGVSLSFNGEPVELARYSRNNVANLVLGE